MPEFDQNAVNHERNCLEFIEWERGFSPREHFEMRDMRTAHRQVIEVQKQQAKQVSRNLWVTLGIGVATVASVIVMGVLNLIFN